MGTLGIPSMSLPRLGNGKLDQPASSRTDFARAHLSIALNPTKQFTEELSVYITSQLT